MSGYFATRAARRRGIAFGALLATSILLMAISSHPLVHELQLGVGFALRPVQSAIDGLGQGLASIGTAVTEMDRLRSTNEALERENERLTNENLQAQELRRENELLTGLLQLRNGFEYDTVGAVVIARESNEFRRVVTLDKGAEDGIEGGDVVVAAGGAVAGRIIEVGANYSRVLLISDSGSTVIGQLATSAATGEVVGQLGGALLMSKIDSAVQVVIGEEVVTAGIELAGGIRSPFPKGLVIGLVGDVIRNANEVVQTAIVQPAIDLDRLEYVLIITDYEGGLPPPGGPGASCAPSDAGATPPPSGPPASEEPCVTASPPALPTPTPQP